MRRFQLREKRRQVYIVSLYPAGQRWAADCYPEFLATREEAIEAGEAALVTYEWAVRYSIRKIWLTQVAEVTRYA